MGLHAAFFLAKNSSLARRVSWLTAVFRRPITVAGPRPILTAFPQIVPRLRNLKSKSMLVRYWCQTTDGGSNKFFTGSYELDQPAASAALGAQAVSRALVEAGSAVLEVCSRLGKDTPSKTKNQQDD